jgi:hypothetical protein
MVDPDAMNDEQVTAKLWEVIHVHTSLDARGQDRCIPE